MTTIQFSVLTTLLVLLVFMVWAGFRTQKTNADREWEYRKLEARTLDTYFERVSKSHLEILKALKGESYSGQLFGLDVHTDENIPPGVSHHVPTHDELEGQWETNPYGYTAPVEDWHGKAKGS